jgi:hypothetical protein
MFCEHAEAISTGKLLERNLLVNTPPGTSKSMLWAVLWPAWEWTWAPWFRWLTTSYDDGLALRDAVKTRRLMQTEWYDQQKSIEWHFVGDQNVKSNYVNDRTGWRIAASILGGITGNHAHRVLVDDPHNVREAESDLIRESTLTVWREVFPSRVLPSGSRIMIGQRTHEEDATADWLGREGDQIHHIELRMEHEVTPLGHQLPPECSLSHAQHDQRTHEGDLLVPERFPPRVIELRKIELGPYAYSAQYQQSPSPRAGGLLDPAWFPQTPKLERSTVDLVCAFDLNYSDAATSDWTVGLLGAIERDPVLPRIHLIDAFREHLAEKDHVAHIGEWLCLWRPVLVGIEKRAYERQGATGDLCRQLMAYCEERGFGLTIEPITVDTDKVTRAMIIPGRAKAGRITADKRTPWWTILARQMSQFPRSAHDDDVDALAHLVRLVVEKLQKVRAQQQLIGKSAQLVIEEAEAPEADRALAMAAGYR